MGPPSEAVPLKGTEKDTETRSREGDHLKMVAEVAVMCLQTTVTTRSEERSPGQ